MQNQRDRELNSAVEFICRNSSSSLARTELLRQVIRCHVSRDFSERLMTTSVRQEIESRCKTIARQFAARGFM